MAQISPRTLINYLCMVYRSFTELQKALVLGLFLLMTCSIFGVRSPFFCYSVVSTLTYISITNALCTGYYATICRDFIRKRQDELYNLLDSHLPELRQSTLYTSELKQNFDHSDEDAPYTQRGVESSDSAGLQNGVVSNYADHIPEYQIEISKLVQHVFKDFILSWYLTISDELTFAQNIHVVLEEVVIAIENNLREIDRFEFSKKIIQMYTTHLADYQNNVNVLKTQPKYYKNKVTFTKLNNVLEVYEKQDQFHPALATDETELNHIRSIICSAIHKLVPPDRLTSVAGMELLVEILSTSLIQPLLTVLSEPDFIYELLIKILAEDDDVIMNEIRNHHQNVANGDVRVGESMNNGNVEQKLSDSTLQRFQDVVEALTAKSHHFLKTFSEQNSLDESSHSSSFSELTQRLRSMTTPYEDINVHTFRRESANTESSIGSSLEIVETDDDLDPVDYQLLKVRTESNVSDYLMIVPTDEDADELVHSNLTPGDVRLRRALTEERRPRSLTRQFSLPTLDEDYDTRRIDDDLSYPSTPDDLPSLPSLPRDPSLPFLPRDPSLPFLPRDPSLPFLPRDLSHSLPTITDTTSITSDDLLDLQTDYPDTDFDNISITSEDSNNWERNLLTETTASLEKPSTGSGSNLDPATGSTSSLDSCQRPRDLTLLHTSLASLPDVTSSTSLFENLYVTGTETMQEYGSPENRYVCYVVQYDGWYYGGDGLTRVPCVVRRRFREFVALHECLNENPVCRGLLKGIRGPNRWWTLPFNKLDNKIVDKRKVALQNYLQTLIKKQPLAVSQEMKEFLAYDSDASLAFVRKAPDMPVQWLDKVFLKPVSGVLDKITTALPSFPPSSDMTSSLKSDVTVNKRRVANDDAQTVPDKDEDALHLEYMIVAESEKFSVSRLPNLVMAYLHQHDAEVAKVTEVTEVNASDTSQTVEVMADDEEEIFYDVSDGQSPISLSKRTKRPSLINQHPVTSLFADMPLACSVLDLGAQLTSELKLTFYNQQVLGVFYVFVGWYFDRFLRSEIVDISCEAMIAKYLHLLRTTLWPEEEQPVETPKTPQQLDKTRQWAAKCLTDFFPWFIPLVVGSENLAGSADLIMTSFEHPKLNRHLILTALDLIVDTVIPDMSVNDDVIRGPQSEFRARDE